MTLLELLSSLLSSTSLGSRTVAPDQAPSRRRGRMAGPQRKVPCVAPGRALALRAPSPSPHQARKEPLRDPGAERQVRSLSRRDAGRILYFLIILLSPQGARVPFCCQLWWALCLVVLVTRPLPPCPPTSRGQRPAPAQSVPTQSHRPGRPVDFLAVTLCPWMRRSTIFIQPGGKVGKEGRGRGMFWKRVLWSRTPVNPNRSQSSSYTLSMDRKTKNP